MANQEHLDILLQGVEVWNAWRKDREQGREEYELLDLEPDLNLANLAGMTLEGVNLRGAHLFRANLQGANLQGADLQYANCDEADLSDANLAMANLCSISFVNTVLRNTNVSYALMEATIFGDVDLSQVQELETVDHLGPSTIYLATIVKSHGQIPEVFLRGAQGHATFYECFIEYNRLLTGESTDYPPCFLVYAPNDEELARRLARDLQTHGIRCWFDTDTLRPGRFFSQLVVSPVRFYDRVVLILSEPTDMVEEYDIEVTLEQEERDGRRILFPLFTDSKILTSIHPWTVYLRETRDLGDFRQWQNEAEYQQAFSQLLHDLTAEEQEETKPFLIDYALLAALKEQRDLKTVPNQEQLDILLQGVEVWNAWRENQKHGEDDIEFSALEPDLNNANLAGMNLAGADLSEAHLWRANLQGTNLKGADLSYANLAEADLSEANLSEAHLGYTMFTYTNLRNMNISHGMMYVTIFSNVDLSQAKGLDTVKHLGSSSIDLETILKSHGHIPEAFLRGAQGHNTFYECFIEYNRLLTGESTDYPPCFLVYSSKDEDLARRLAEDLQTHGIRCWFDADNVSPGRFLYRGLVSPVRFYEKVVLILSGEPEYNAWADDDIRAVLEQEERDDQKVLFPLFRDTKVLTSDQPWTTYLRETRELGDFRQWQNEVEYQLAFIQLLRDLKAEE